MRTLYFGRLDEQLRLAPAVSVNLLQQVVEACPRLPWAQQSKQATDIDRFIEARSWTDLAIGLVRLELLTWQIRRIACEGSEWICSLSPVSRICRYHSMRPRTGFIAICRWPS
jgi:hypothetical protein